MGNAEPLGRALRGGRWLVIRCYAPIPPASRCDHEARWPAELALRYFGPGAHRYDVTRRLRCSRCRSKGHVDVGVT